MIGAVSDCVLAFTPQKQIVCAILPYRQIVGVWPYSSLRTYWGGKDQFGFKAGRRSPRGEGEFVFATKQGEEIYLILEKTIKMTLQDTKSRPPATLPLDPTRTETPVPSSESEEELSPKETSAPPIPLKPPDLLKRTSIVALPQPSSTPNMGMVNVDISETSPAYVTRTRSTPLFKQTGDETRYTVREELQVEDIPTRPPLPLPVQSPPTSQGNGSDIDETYSHATHVLPRLFTRDSSLKIIEGDRVYNGLVRRDSTSSTTSIARTNKLQSDSIPESVSDHTYDLAYPATSMQSKILVPVHEGDYASLGNPGEQQKLRMEKKLQNNGRMLSSGSLSFGAQLRGRVENVDGGKNLARQNSDNELTINPLYGSKDNIFSTNIVNMARVESKDMPEYSPIVGTHGNNNPLNKSTMFSNPAYGCPTGNVPPNQRPDGVSPLEDSMVANPMYGGHENLGIVRQKECVLEESLDLSSNGNLKSASNQLSGEDFDGSNVKNSSNLEPKGCTKERRDGAEPGSISVSALAPGNISNKNHQDQETSDKSDVVVTPNSIKSPSKETGENDHRVEADRTIPVPDDSNSDVSQSHFNQDQEAVGEQNPPVPDGSNNSDVSQSQDQEAVSKQSPPVPDDSSNSDVSQSDSNQNREAVSEQSSVKRKVKGYSKIDKNKKANEQGQQEDEDLLPPPIPPRNYNT